MSFRTEHDLLGEMQIPAEAYYGIHTARAMDNFHISGRYIEDYPQILIGMAKIKKACALANMDFHIIPKKAGEAICWACDQIIEHGAGQKQSKFDLFQGGAGTSLNMNSNEIIANIALEHMGYKKGEYEHCNPNDVVNQSQSTNCAYPSGLRMVFYHDIIRMTEAMEVLRDSLARKGAEFDQVIKMGRTQLQDAVPMSMGDEFKGFAKLVQLDIDAIREGAKCLLGVNLGATAIGNGINAPQGFNACAVKHLRDVTGWDIQECDNLIAATSDTGDYVLAHALIKRFAVRLAKICNDLRLMGSGPRAGLNEIKLPERQAGSSIMPGKVNPVIPEVANQVCFKVRGNDITITAAADAAQLQLNVMEPVILQAFVESCELMYNACITLSEKCVDGIIANVEHCRNDVLHSIGLATFLNPFIGHSNADLVCRRCAKENRDVIEVVQEMNLMTEEQVKKLLDIENLARPVTNFIKFDE